MRPSGTGPVEVRRSPLLAQLALLLGFLLLAVASVFTVLIPELVDDGDEESGTPEAAEAAPDAPAE